MKKLIIQVVLMVIIVIMGYFVFESIMEPVRFENERFDREKVVVENLKDIRSAQLAYKALNDTFVPSFDTLIKFIIEGQIPIVNIIPDPTDTTFTRSINDTIGYVLVQDSLFKKRINFDALQLRYIPGTKSEFKLETGEIKRGGLRVSGVEVSAEWKDILEGMDHQLTINYIKRLTDIDKFPGLKFGSLLEPSTDGTWD